jgi:hypothetical protein
LPIFEKKFDFFFPFQSKMSEVTPTNNLSDLRVVDLRTELSKRGLPTSGRKQELVDRLSQSLESNSGELQQSQGHSQASSKAMIVSHSQESEEGDVLEKGTKGNK